MLPFAAVEIATAGLPVIDERTLPWIAVVVLATGIGAFLGYNISLTLQRPGADLGLAHPHPRLRRRARPWL